MYVYFAFQNVGEFVTRVANQVLEFTNARCVNVHYHRRESLAREFVRKVRVCINTCFNPKGVAISLDRAATAKTKVVRANSPRGE